VNGNRGQVIPTGTVIDCGPKTKLSIFTAAGAADGWSFALTRCEPVNARTTIITGIAKPVRNTSFFVFVIAISFLYLISLLPLLLANR
jgi:hypothetical protein